MATLILMVGLPGSGKTTMARSLEASRPALRLTPDEWMTGLEIDGYDEEARARVEALQWTVAARVLSLGLDVVLDWGFWSREERDDYRARAAALDVGFEMMYLEVSRDELWRRLSARNEDLLNGCFRVEERHLEEWWQLFEPPAGG